MLLYLKLTYLRSVLKSFDNFFDFVHWGKCIVRFLPKKMWESLHLNRTIFPKLFKYQTDQSRLQKPFIKIDLVKDRSHDIGSSMFYFHYLLDHLILHLELHLQASRCGGLPFSWVAQPQRSRLLTNLTKMAAILTTTQNLNTFNYLNTKCIWYNIQLYKIFHIQWGSEKWTSE